MRLEAADPDLGANGHVDYAIIGGGDGGGEGGASGEKKKGNEAELEEEGAFTIHPTRGELRVNSKLDAEKKNQHFLRIKATDQVRDRRKWFWGG